MSDMWMPPQTTRPPLLHRLQRGRHQRADRGEDDCGVERLGRRLLRAARPHRAERAREVLRGGVALAGESEHAPALPDRHLRQDMGGGAEAVETERQILSDLPSPAMR